MLHDQLRFAWYAFMTLLERNEEVQRLGIVRIMYCHYSDERIRNFPDFSVITAAGKRYTRMCEALPMQQVSFHLCYDNPLMMFAIGPLSVVVGKAGRLRMATHQGKWGVGG